MQRSGIAGLLFVLALAVQVMLPGVSAFAHSGGGSAAGYELCWNADSNASLQQDDGSGPPERRHHDGCLFCQGSSSVATAFVAVATTTAFVSASYQLRGFAADAAPPRSYDQSVRQARAPPQFS